jgi:hypothetical protein
MKLSVAHLVVFHDRVIRETRILKDVKGSNPFVIRYYSGSCQMGLAENQDQPHSVQRAFAFELGALKYKAVAQMVSSSSHADALSISVSL